MHTVWSHEQCYYMFELAKDKYSIPPVLFLSFHGAKEFQESLIEPLTDRECSNFYATHRFDTFL